MAPVSAKSQISELLRFGVVGVALNLGLYILYLIVALWVPPAMALTLIYPGAILASYYAHRRWTYRSEVTGASPLLRYALIFGGGYVTNLVLLLVMTQSFAIPHQIAQAACIFIVAAQSYALGKLWVFRTQTGLSGS